MGSISNNLQQQQRYAFLD